mgnify:CR=1 FL=1
MGAPHEQPLTIKKKKQFESNILMFYTGVSRFASKIAADAMAMSFYNAFNLPVTIARPFNTYGPRQSARAIIPSIIIQIASGKKTIELGDLSPTRDFNYVEDIANGFYLALKSKNKKIFGEVINLGTGYEISIKKIGTID